jgi:thioredoxin reductase
MDNFRHHAESAGSEILFDTVKELKKENNIFIVETETKKVFTSDYVILATGNKYRQL